MQKEASIIIVDYFVERLAVVQKEQQGRSGCPAVDAVVCADLCFAPTVTGVDATLFVGADLCFIPAVAGIDTSAVITANLRFSPSITRKQFSAGIGANDGLVPAVTGINGSVLANTDLDFIPAITFVDFSFHHVPPFVPAGYLQLVVAVGIPILWLETAWATVVM